MAKGISYEITWKKHLLQNTISNINDLGKLDYGFQLINMEVGFFIARFYSGDDYLRVMKDGP